MAKTLRNSKPALAAEAIIADYRLAFSSRRASIIGRAEVLRGNATFGIFGDGKEVAQLAMAKAFRPGDWRAGYYRDQTFMWATRMSNVREFFSQLYGNTNLEADPATGGRQMGNHFATRFVDDRGEFKRSVETPNSTADVSNVAGWMPRLLGLAYASKLYRNNPQLRSSQDGFSVNGNEVAFGTIGDAATSEGHFWETVNAAGVLQVPIALSVWDDGYGISVPISAETTKSSISDVLRGFIPDDRPGIDIHVIPGWDYAALVEAYRAGIERVRTEHKPALFHITELTQPQGHSTSGSHERYKSKERLRFEVEYDCITRMRDWIIESGFASESQIEGWEAADKEAVEAARDLAWEAYQAPIRKERDRAVSILRRIDTPKVAEIASTLNEANKVTRSAIISGASFALRTLRGTESPERRELIQFIEDYKRENSERYSSHVYSTSDESPLKVPVVPPVYSDSSPTADGRQVLLRNFDANFARDPRLFVIGEDVGRLGDVNLVFEGLQAKYGDLRLTDTGIRETTILGQAIGAAMRGLRPICDIQYLDYFLYTLEVASDNLGEFTVPLGVPEVLLAGTDVTVVTYGACCGIALDAARALEELGVSCEVIDVQTLNPFDVDHSIVRSLEKTHAVLFLDEDMPGGASAFMMQQVLERQDGWWHLDSAPRTLAGAPNRPAYGPDGDYFTKPNRESVVEAIYALMRERRPETYAPLD